MSVDRSNDRLRNFTCSAIGTYGASTPNTMYLKCGWTSMLRILIANDVENLTKFMKL
jgi:hypothetical protein